MTKGQEIVAVIARHFGVDDHTIARAIYVVNTDVRVYECLSFVAVRLDDGGIQFYPVRAGTHVSSEQRQSVLAVYEWRLVERRPLEIRGEQGS